MSSNDHGALIPRHEIHSINQRCMKMNQEIFKIDFKDEDALSELLSSTETDMQEVRDGYVARLKNGERILANIAGFPACALALGSGLFTRTDGDALEHKLIAIPLS